MQLRRGNNNYGRTKLLWPDGELDLATACLHAFEGLRQIGQTDFLGHEIVGRYVAPANGFECIARESWSMVKRRNQFNFRIVYGSRLDFHLGAAGQAAEEIYHAAATNHVEGLLPGDGITGGFHDGIGTALIFGQCFYGGDNIGGFVDVDGRYRAEALCEFQSLSAARQGNDTNSAPRKHAHEFQADGSATNDGRGVTAFAGEMIDEATRKSAEDLLARGRAAGLID